MDLTAVLVVGIIFYTFTPCGQDRPPKENA